MTAIRLTSLALVSILLGATIRDPYGWYRWLSYDVADYAWWKVAISALDVLLLALLGWYIALGRWRQALTLGVVECAFAATAGLFIAHLDLIRNASTFEWLPGLRVLLGLYMATLVLRLVLVILLFRAVSRIAGAAAAHTPLPAA